MDMPSAGSAENLNQQSPRSYTLRFKQPAVRKQPYRDRRAYQAQRYSEGKTWNQVHREERSEYHKKLWTLLRDKAIEKYGSKCVCCGLAEKPFLTFDHVEGGGRQHRKRLGGFGFLLWMEKNNYPPEIQLLCYNCNGAKRAFGACPHQTLGAKETQ